MSLAPAAPYGGTPDKPEGPQQIRVIEVDDVSDTYDTIEDTLTNPDVWFSFDQPLGSEKGVLGEFYTF